MVEDADSVQFVPTKGLEELSVVTKNRKQIDQIFEYYARASNQHHRAGGKNLRTTGLSFKGLSSFLRDFELLPTVFSSLSAAQEVFHAVNYGSASIDVLTNRRFLDLLDRTAQIYAAARQADASSSMHLLLHKMEGSSGRSKLSNARNGIVLRPFSLPPLKKAKRTAVAQKRKAKPASKPTRAKQPEATKKKLTGKNVSNKKGLKTLNPSDIVNQYFERGVV